MHFQNSRPSLLDFLYRDVRRTERKSSQRPRASERLQESVSFPQAKPPASGSHSSPNLREPDGRSSKFIFALPFLKLRC